MHVKLDMESSANSINIIRYDLIKSKYFLSLSPNVIARITNHSDKTSGGNARLASSIVIVWFALMKSKYFLKYLEFMARIAKDSDEISGGNARLANSIILII